MNTIINGTAIRSTPSGLVLTRGKRELHILGTSVSQTTKAHKLAADYSFNKLFTAAKTSPIKNTRYMKLAG